MPRTARASVGGVCYHVINRGNRHEEVFLSAADYLRFLNLMAQARARLSMRVLTYCLMPNHFHLLLRPYGDGDLSRWMHWLLTTHVRRHHRCHGTDGRIWQGRFKAFPVAEDRYLTSVARYIERNPVRASLVTEAGAWSWSSLNLAPTVRESNLLDLLPEACAPQWHEYVNTPQSSAEIAALRECTARNRPYGPARWQRDIAARLGLESSLRRPGRPAKKSR